MEDNKITESMLKRALKKKYEISSVGAIILFTILSVLFGVIVYLLLELFFSILKGVPVDTRMNIVNVIGNVVEFKGFYIIASIVMSLILVAIFIKVMNHNFILTGKKQDFIQKFIIVILVLTCVSVLVNLKNGKREIDDQFLSLHLLEYADCNSFEHNRELYDRYHKDDNTKFSNVDEIRDYYLQRYESTVETYLVRNNTKVILESFILMVVTSIGVIFFYRKKDN